MKNKDDYITRNKKVVSFQPDRKAGRRSNKRITVLVAGIVCVLCAFGMVGVYQMETENTTQEEPLVDWEDSVTSDLEDKVQVRMSGDGDENVTAQLETIETEAPQSTQNEEYGEQNADSPQMTETGESLQPTEAAEDSSVGQDALELAEEQSEQAAVENAIALRFTENDSLTWPIDGSIVLDYSMDATTYFPTLDQYKYNPAVLLQAEVGEKVCAAASGMVESIVESDETGLTVTMNIGNGYQLVYGQLQGIEYSTGAYLEKGDVVGTVATPTKYYSVEGCNLYFKMLKDSAPVNPVDYMREGQTVE